MFNRPRFCSLFGPCKAVVAVMAPLAAGFMVAQLGLGAPGAEAHDDAYEGFGPNPLVVGEVAPLRRQLARCWKVPAMTRREDFDVHIRIALRADGTVGTARIVDYGWIVADPHRLSVAKSARRALASASCNPLRIPRASRRRGDRFTLTLNPRVIFRRY